MALYYFAELCRFIACKLPTSLSYLLACAVGDVLYLVWARGRRSVKENVAAALGSGANPSVVRRIARQCMRNFCKYAIDFLRFSSLSPHIGGDRVTIHGLENLDSALREGKGAILVSLHIGNFDLGVRLISRLGYPVSAIVDTLKIGQVDRLVRKWRANLGVRLIATKEGVTKMAEVLRKNELLALLIDCPEYERGIEVKFGHKSAMLPAGAATLALRTGAKVIPCGLVRLSNNTFHGFIGEHIKFHPSGNLTLDIKEFTQCIVSALERIARQFTDQWYMFRPLAR